MFYLLTLVVIKLREFKHLEGYKKYYYEKNNFTLVDGDNFNTHIIAMQEGRLH